MPNQENNEEEIILFKKQDKIYPARVWGRYRIVKWISMIILLGIYYLSPFIRWDRGPKAPDQAILIDMPARRAYFFFIEIWPHEVYYLTGLLILSAIGLFFITSLFGRIWCGYACFQTVWTDLFIWVERIIQGDRNARMRLDKKPLFNLEKIWKKILTHILWVIIGLCTGGAWVLYFNDAPTLIEQIIHFDVPMSVMGWVLALTGTTYLMAGFAREQVCIYMCPYARFQSAMFDKDTMIIGYDERRGEKRGKKKKAENWDNRGDCIDCKQCVNVCPTGIDIRDGLQLECIACGHCVDACNNIMDKIGLPQGLIRYDTLNNIEKEDKYDKKSHILRPRTFYYLAIMGLVASIMLYGLVNREPFELHVLHDRNPLFVKQSNGQIRNGYIIKILNKTHEDRIYKIEVLNLDKPILKVQGTSEETSEHLMVFADSIGQFRLFILADKQDEARLKIRLKITDLETKFIDNYSSIFMSDN